MYKTIRLTLVLVWITVAGACIQDKSPLPTSPLSFDLTGPETETLMVLVHGWLCDRTYWKNQVAHFEKTHRVLNVDLMNHGDSAAESRTTIKGLAADVAPIVSQLGPKKVILVGHSMGGNVVVEIANQLPASLPTLVVGVDTLREPNEPVDLVRLEQTMAAMEADFEGTTVGFVSNAFFLPGTDPKFVSAIASDMAQGPKAVGTSLIKALVHHDLPQGLRDMAARTLVVINSTYQPTDLEGLKQHHPDVTLREMDGVGHFLHMEKPEAFNQLLDQVIQNWN